MKSSKEDYNIKTHRIAEEMQKYGWKIKDMKHITKKNPSQRKLLKIIITNQKSLENKSL